MSEEAEGRFDLSIAKHNPDFLLAAIRHAITHDAGDAVIAANARLYLVALERQGRWAGDLSSLPLSVGDDRRRR